MDVTKEENAKRRQRWGRGGVYHSVVFNVRQSEYNAESTAVQSCSP